MHQSLTVIVDMTCFPLVSLNLKPQHDNRVFPVFLLKQHKAHLLDRYSTREAFFLSTTININHAEHTNFTFTRASCTDPQIIYWTIINKYLLFIPDMGTPPPPSNSSSFLEQPYTVFLIHLVW